MRIDVKVRTLPRTLHKQELRAWAALRCESEDTANQLRGQEKRIYDFKKFQSKLSSVVYNYKR
jgi:hypothetical protein